MGQVGRGVTTEGGRNDQLLSSSESYCPKRADKELEEGFATEGQGAETSGTGMEREAETPAAGTGGDSLWIDQCCVGSES
jgi:hypothetical protein